MNEPFVVVPCSGAKRPDLFLPAGERYTGSLHLLARQAAAVLTSPDRVRIASARYGLCRLERVTEPYDRRIDGLNKDDWRQLCSWMHCDSIDMHDQDPDAAIIALVPQKYLEAMRWSPLTARKLVTPLAGCRGIGEMRHMLAGIRDRRSLAA